MTAPPPYDEQPDRAPRAFLAAIGCTSPAPARDKSLACVIGGAVLRCMEVAGLADHRVAPWAARAPSQVS